MGKCTEICGTKVCVGDQVEFKCDIGGNYYKGVISGLIVISNFRLKICIKRGGKNGHHEFSTCIDNISEIKLVRSKDDE